jgi:hypothetical protein
MGLGYGLYFLLKNWEIFLSEIIEHDDSGSGERSVQVGDLNSSISVKVYQDIYHQVTGRTEQIKKRYSENLLIEFAEIEQLHHKVMQLCDVHHVVARNEVISVFHEKERKEQFTSFERFRTYNSNTASPSVVVVLKYNFSIIPAGLQRPQEYVVNIRLTSRVAMTKQMEKEAPPFMRSQLIGLLTDNTAELSVDYTDYVIARGFFEAFDEWIKGCKSTPKKKWLMVLRRWSHFLPNVIKICVVLMLAEFALRAIPDFFGLSVGIDKGIRFLVIYSTAAYILILLSALAGELIEDAIDTYPVLSYLKLNRGDSNLIDEYTARKTKVIIKFIGGVVLTIVLGIVSAKLEKLI